MKVAVGFLMLCVLQVLDWTASFPVVEVDELKDIQNQYPVGIKLDNLQAPPKPKGLHGKERIIEGDVITNENAFDKNGALANERWLNARIPYYIDPAFSQTEKNLILSTMTEFFQKTAVHFVPWIQGEKDYIYIRKGGANTGCNSYVGNIKNGQNVNLEVSTSANCIHFKTVLHELMHAAGFWHEQSRPDRETYVEIDLNNVPKNFWHAFDLKPYTTTFNLPYDIYSLMHYGRYDFAIDRNKWTIRPRGKDANVEWLGVQSSNPGFTDLDIQKMNAMYPLCSRGFTDKAQKGSFWQFSPGQNFADVSYTTMRSVKVEPGCTLRVCSAKNFGGTCKSLIVGVWDFSYVEASIDNNVRALSCTC